MPELGRSETEKPTTIVNIEIIKVELPAAFDPRWNHLPGISVEGRVLAVDPAEYFFRFETNPWLVGIRPPPATG